MATASVPNADFQNGTAADADEVDANFSALTDFLNASVVHLDGTKEMSGLLTLHTADPTSARHAVSKDWLDGPFFSATTGVTQSFTSGVTQNVKWVVDTDTDGAYVTGTGLYTPTRPGLYQVSWAMTPTADSTAVHAMEIQAGGVSFLGPRLKPSVVSPTFSPWPSMAATVQLTAGQSIATRASIEATVNKALGGWSTIVWLHD